MVGHARFPEDVEANYVTLPEETHRWKRVLEDGKYRSAGELAEAEGVTRSFVNRLLRLTPLAPDAQEAILEGRHAKGMQLEELTRAMPIVWGEQCEVLPSTMPCEARQEATR